MPDDRRGLADLQCQGQHQRQRGTGEKCLQDLVLDGKGDAEQRRPHQKLNQPGRFEETRKVHPESSDKS